MGAPVVHFEIMGKDAKRTQEFYRSLFGWEADTNNPMNYGIITPSAKEGIGGGIGQVMENQSAYVTFYVGVDDVQGYLDKAVSIGGNVVMPLTEVPNMVTFALFSDLDGNVVGVVKNVMPPPKPKKAKKAKKAKKSASKKKSPKSKKSKRRR